MLNFCKYKDQSPFQGESNLVFRGRFALMEIVIWIKTYLEYTYLNSDPELQQAVTEKLLSIPQVYGNMLRLFFADRIAEDYTTLLSNYIMLLINLINAQKNGDVKAIDEYSKQLYQNDDQKADYLSKVNPFWQKSILKDMLSNYTKMTINEITTLSSKDYKRNINIFDSILSYSSVIGDYLAEGIANYLTYSTQEPNIPK